MAAPSNRAVRTVATALGPALAALVAAGCASPLASLREKSTLPTDSGQFVLHFSAQDREAVRKVELALERAVPRLNRWGTLRDPVDLHVLPTHDLLEAAVNRHGFDWLRAWARYDEVFLQSPRTWGLMGAAQDQLDELLLHELTHCLMYQQAATRTAWSRKQIPLWFREGMASFTANQGYRWPALEDLAQFFERAPGADPVKRPEEMYQHKSQWVYGASHHAFAFLVRRYGEDKVRELLGAMYGGQEFPEAFSDVIGLAPERFADDFKRFVRLRGFAGERLRRAPATR